VGPAVWQGLLGCAVLAGLTELNELAWSPERSDAVRANLARVERRKATAEIDLR
jgi:hypothetical protein